MSCIHSSEKAFVLVFNILGVCGHFDVKVPGSNELDFVHNVGQEGRVYSSSDAHTRHTEWEAPGELKFNKSKVLSHVKRVRWFHCCHMKGSCSFKPDNDCYFWENTWWGWERKTLPEYVISLPLFDTEIEDWLSNLLQLRICEKEKERVYVIWAQEGDVTDQPESVLKRNSDHVKIDNGFPLIQYFLMEWKSVDLKERTVHKQESSGCSVQDLHQCLHQKRVLHWRVRQSFEFQLLCHCDFHSSLPQDPYYLDMISVRQINSHCDMEYCYSSLERRREETNLWCSH